MRRCGCGGIGLAQCSLPTSGGSGSTACGAFANGNRHRRPQIIPCGNARTRQSRPPQHGALDEQPSREQSPAIPTTRASDAAVPADEDAGKSPRSTPACTTTSIRNVTSSTDRSTSFAAQPHWPSGSRSLPEATLPRREPRQSETSCDPTDSTSTTTRRSRLPRSCPAQRLHALQPSPR